MRRLFVYGTLMRTATGAMGALQRRRLQSVSTSLGPAQTGGRLFDLGQYPGLVVSHEAGPTVHGELLELVDPEPTLRWLDAYEGIVAGDHRNNAYERLMRPVSGGNGAEAEAEAWVYIYRGALEGARLLPDGRWVASG